MSFQHKNKTEDQKAACDFAMPFGKHKGRTFYDIATEDGDEGVKYLDWLAGRDNLFPETKKALTDFLSIDWVANKLDAALED